MRGSGPHDGDAMSKSLRTVMVSARARANIIHEAKTCNLEWTSRE
jgi:hypothetical protein